jgi:ketosteroid isomerase-like protein
MPTPQAPVAPNVAVVKHVYERFARGDAAAVLAAFAPNVEFRLAQGHPYQPSGAPWIGKDAVTQNFFMKAGPEWEGWTIHPDAIHDLADVVVVECRYTGKYKPTDKPMDVQVCHVWTLESGKVTRFHQYLDTARLQDVMRR